MGQRPKPPRTSIQFTIPSQQELKRRKRRGESYEEMMRRLGFL